MFAMVFNKKIRKIIKIVYHSSVGLVFDGTIMNKTQKQAPILQSV